MKPLERKWIILAIPLAAILALSEWRTYGPPPKRGTAPTAEFSATRAYDALRATVGGERPHPIGVPEHAAVRDRVLARFEALGYTTRLHRTFACNGRPVCAPVENIEAIRPGAPQGNAVVLVAHYDSVPAAPGASDDGTGVATLLETARALRNERHRNPVLFLVDDGEEAGLLGAEAVVAARDLLRPVGVVVNLESRGTSGPSYMFETSRNNGSLAPLVARSLPTPATASLFPSIYEMLPNDTDLTVFKRAAASGVNFAFLGDVVYYHTPLDDLAHVSLRTLQHNGDNVLATTRALADAALPLRSGHDAVWFDVLGFFVVSWPAPVTLPIAVGVLLIALAASVIAVRRSEASVAEVLAAIGLVVVAMLVAAGVTLLVERAIHLRSQGTWAAHPLAENAAVWFVALGSAIAIHALPGRRVRAAAAYAALSIVTGGGAVAVVLLLPGASYLLIVPAAATAIMSLLFVSRRADATAVAVVSSSVTALLYFPLALQLYAALGSLVLPAVGVVIVLVTLGIGPVVANPRPVVAIALVAALLLTATAALLPRVTRERPARNSLTWLDDGNGRWWIAQRVTPALRGAARFGGSRTQFFPWRRAAFESAPAPAAGAAPVVLRRISGSPTVTRIAVSSRRGAQRVALYFATGAKVVALRVNGVTPPPRPARFQRDVTGGWHSVVVRASAMEVEIQTDRPEPIDAFALDTTYGLPPAGRALARARDASNQVPSDDGDVTITMRSARF